MIGVETLARFLAVRHRPYLNQQVLWMKAAHRYVRLARQLIVISQLPATKQEIEMAIQEKLLDAGWNNPLRDAAYLVDGPLAAMAVAS